VEKSRNQRCRNGKGNRRALVDADVNYKVAKDLTKEFRIKRLEKMF
jgi:signal recognition particle GTPase